MTERYFQCYFDLADHGVIRGVEATVEWLQKYSYVHPVEITREEIERYVREDGYCRLGGGTTVTAVAIEVDADGRVIPAPLY
jgi:hypothetical protein